MDLTEFREVLACCTGFPQEEREAFMCVAYDLFWCSHLDGKGVTPYFAQAIESGRVGREELNAIAERSPQIIHALKDLLCCTVDRVWDVAKKGTLSPHILALAIGRAVWRAR